MRRRGPGLLGTVARTAVIAGTATHVSNNVSRRQAERQQGQQEQHDAEVQAQAEQLSAQQQQYAPAPVAAAAPAVDFEQLKKLGEMRDAGILTDEEFSAAKARVLGL